MMLPLLATLAHAGDPAPAPAAPAASGTQATAAEPVSDTPDAPAPPPAVPSPADDDLPDTFTPTWLASPNDHLELRKNDRGWEVVNADGRRLTADRFAELTGDIPYFIERNQDLKRAMAARTGLYITGGALFFGAILAAAVDGPRAPAEEDYVVDPDNYSSYGQYEEARESMSAAWEDDYGRYREGRWLSAAFCAASGTFAMVSAPLLGKDVRERRAEPDRVWSERRANEKIEEYNKAHSPPAPAVSVSATVGPGGLALTGRF